MTEFTFQTRETPDDEDLENIDDLDAAVTAVAELRTSVEKHQKDTDKKLDTRLSEITDSVKKLETRLNRPGYNRNKKDDDEEKQLQRRAFTNFCRQGVETMDPIEARALTVGTNSAGGYLVPDDFQLDVIRDLSEHSPVRQYARIGRTNRDKQIYPKRLTGVTVGTVTETGPRPTSEPTFGQLEIPVFEYSVQADISNHLLEDSGVNIEEELRLAFSEGFGEQEAADFVNGTGTGQPKGFMVDANVPETTAASATVIDPDELIDLMHAVKSAYRRRGVWMLNSTSIASIRKLKDNDGAYIWRESIAEGNPPTLLGRPVVESVDMPDVSTGESPIVFGDFKSGYQIVDRIDLSVLRDPFTVAGNGLVRFLARRRVGGAVRKAEAFRKYTMA